MGEQEGKQEGEQEERNDERALEQGKVVKEERGVKGKRVNNRMGYTWNKIMKMEWRRLH